MPKAKKGSTSARGYGTDHQRRRRIALAKAYGTKCRKCGKPMLLGQPLDFGHAVDLALDPTAKADEMEHRSCNRSAGGKLGQERQKYAPSRSVIP